MKKENKDRNDCKPQKFGLTAFILYLKKQISEYLERGLCHLQKCPLAVPRLINNPLDGSKVSS